MQPEKKLPVLSENYYLVNFCELIEFVSAAYSDLLVEEEAAFARDFAQCSEPAQRLYVRLLCRSKNLFRKEKLNYPEIVDLDKAIDELVSRGFMLLDPLLEIDEALSLVTKPEIAHWLWQQKRQQKRQPDAVELSKSDLAKLKREELEQKVFDWYDELYEPSTSSNLSDVMVVPVSESPCTGSTILEPCREEVFQIYKLCFFGNLYQDMTDFVLRDLGLARYENYRIDRETRAIRDRTHLKAHLQYYHVLDEIAGLEELTVAEAQRLSDLLPETEDLTLQRRIDRFRNRLARDLERCEELEVALAMFALSNRPPARERRARILAATGRHEEALALCREVVTTPADEEEKHIVSGFASRLARKTDTPWEHVKPYKPPQDTVCLPDSGASVELQVRDYFSSEGQCFYTENVLFDAVFGLAFWEQIFMPVVGSGVFFNPFQRAPADFYDADFVRTRQHAIDQQFETLLQVGELESQVLERFASKSGLMNPMVNWRYLDETLLQLALQRIPLADWLAIFRRLLSDTRVTRNGLPDLILFPDAEDAAAYELIEVKGPGDVLQKNQQRWMSFFASQNIAHQVCHVRWTEEVAGVNVGDNAEACLKPGNTKNSGTRRNTKKVPTK